MQIVYYPDPVLDRQADPVDPGREDLREFTRQMLETMVEAHGVGLAAPQVGESLRLFVASETGEVGNGRVFINPEIEPFGPALAMEEGCLSLPDMRAIITRPSMVRVRYEDVDGNRVEEEVGELLGRIIQHEYDHLDGILFMERMTPADRMRVKPDLKTLEEQYRPR